MTTENPAEKKVSGTAMGTAFLRALAVHDPEKRIRGADYLAEIFLEEEQKKPLKNTVIREWVLKNRITSGMYEFMIARTQFFDCLVEQSLKENREQIVLLGAGYDSRSYRFSRHIRNTVIFELDEKTTQLRKQQCLLQNKISIPEQVRFVPINFETDNLADVLTAAGFSKTKKTFFSWEGVSYYLSPSAVDNMLDFIKAHSPPGSSLAFDYASLSEETLNEERIKKFSEKMRTVYSDEPTKFGIRKGKIESFLSERGFRIIEHLTAADMNRKYLFIDDASETGHTGTTAVPALFCLVHAVVAGNEE